MPTFSAIALDSLLETGASRSLEINVPSERHQPSKPPISKLERIKGNPPKERTVSRPQMSPALYATPEAIPLPDSPSSFPPSPYIINHKSRGSRRMSYSEVVSLHQTSQNDKLTDGDTDAKDTALRKSTSFSFAVPETTKEDHSNVVNGGLAEKDSNGTCDGPNSHQNGGNPAEGLEREMDLPQLVTIKAKRDDESTSFASNTELGDDAGADTSQKLATPVGEFYDAWDELSVESGMQSVGNDIEAELREIRLSLLMEIEKRKQVEETLEQMRAHWLRLREQLGQVGVSVSADPTDIPQHDVNVTEQLRCQLEVARFVSESISRGLTKAEAEMEMEAKLKAKNFEITRLSDRLHYYEAVNQEMSQRNQEAVEIARRERQRRKKRQRWVWGSIATTIVLGSSALAWSYLPAGKSSTDVSEPQPLVKDE